MIEFVCRRCGRPSSPSADGLGADPCPSCRDNPMDGRRPRGVGRKTGVPAGARATDADLEAYASALGSDDDPDDAAPPPLPRLRPGRKAPTSYVSVGWVVRQLVRGLEEAAKGERDDDPANGGRGPPRAATDRRPSADAGWGTMMGVFTDDELAAAHAASVAWFEAERKTVEREEAETLRLFREGKIDPAGVRERRAAAADRKRGREQARQRANDRRDDEAYERQRAAGEAERRAASEAKAAEARAEIERRLRMAGTPEDYVPRLADAEMDEWYRARASVAPTPEQTKAEMRRLMGRR